MLTNKKMKKIIFGILQSDGNIKKKYLFKEVVSKIACEALDDASSDALKEVFNACLERLTNKKYVLQEGKKLSLSSEMNCSSRKRKSTLYCSPETTGEINSTVIETNVPDTNFIDKKVKKKRKDNEIEACEQSVIDLAKSVLTENPEDDLLLASRTPAEEVIRDTTILLFYAYCPVMMTKSEQDNAIAYCYSFLSERGVTGRLRVGREGYNATLTGPHSAVVAFTLALKKFAPNVFAQTDFKLVERQPANQMLKSLKVWPVTEIVTYGFDPRLAPLDERGTHLTPQEFHAALEDPSSIVIDVRNYNESLIGKFMPPTTDQNKVLDPCMRRSTEFPTWVQSNKAQFEGRKVLMYCTAGVRCERASALLRHQGVENVFQLEGGIHRYLDAYADAGGGHWKGKNYTFDKRFSHCAAGKEDELVPGANCVVCAAPWDRYQAQMKCRDCSMEVLVCRTCQRAKPPPKKETLYCPLCRQGKRLSRKQLSDAPQ